MTSLDDAIAGGVTNIRRRQLPGGAWISDENHEPHASATHLITLAFIDRIPLVDARGYGRFLGGLQLEDGSFPSYPFSDRGDLSTTALTYAALHIADLPEQREIRARALTFIDAHGGFDAVVRRLSEAGDLTAVYLAMAGLVDPFDLPDPQLAFMVVPGVVPLMLRRINAGIVWVMLFVSGVTRCLRERKRPSGRLTRAVHRFIARRCLRFIESWLNPNGNTNGVTVQSDQAIASLVAFGRSPESAPVHSALSWFEKHKIWDEGGLHLRAFFNHNWQTALCLRALFHAGVNRDDPIIGDALDFLCFSQSRVPMPHVNLRRKHAHRTGGWGFGDDNFILPDMDDTATVLNALGLALDPVSTPALPVALTERVQSAVHEGLSNLLDMQCSSGGWAAFVWNLGDKPAGPIFESPIKAPKTLMEKIRFFRDPPVELQEPAVSGVTGRVLQGLGALGYTHETPEVQSAAEFLRRQQAENGAWWGRWLVAYLAPTACVISGLADCGWDMDEPWIRRAIDWMLSCQNSDGGWGEKPDAYEDISLAGVGPSMPPVTGMVLTALVDAGLADHPAAQRGADYLLATQMDDGSWPSNEWLQVYEPGSTYYFFEGGAWFAPLEALAKYRATRSSSGRGRRRRAVEWHESAASSQPSPAYASDSVEHLSSLRMVSDPAADDAIRVLMRGADPLDWRALTGTPTIAGTGNALPPEVVRFMNETEVLPDWADRERMERGQRLFSRHGWLMITGLFCSSVPQSYCSSDGARVLIQTRGMTAKLHRRVFNTARFLFDICTEGSFRPGGRALRSARKIRLMHALTRAKILQRGNWDSEAWGVPANQADMLGMLLTLSVVVLDALKRAGVRVSQRDQDAYLHLWNVTGYLLGIPRSQLPQDLSQAREWERVYRRTWQRSAHGRLLAGHLIRSMRHHLPGRLGQLPVAMIRFFAGARCADLLELDEARGVERALRLAAAVHWMLPWPSHRLVHWGAGLVMLTWVRWKGHPAPDWFRMPDSLTSLPGFSLARP